MARREFQMPAVLRQEGARPYWYIRYRRKVPVGKNEIERKEVWHTLGSCDAITKRQAQRLRGEIMREVNREVYTIQSQILFEDFAEIYMKQHTITLAPGGQKRDQSLIRNHLVPSFGSISLCEIGTEEVQAFLNAKNGEGLSWWTRKALQAIISSIFSKADDWGYREGRNPARRTSLGRKKPKRERRILTDEQLRLLLDAVPEDVKLMVETAVSTGMRISEILGLKWGCVDLALGIVRVEERFYRGESGEPKSERAKRVLPLGMLTARYQQHMPGGSNRDWYVFERSGRPMDDRAILRNVIRPTAKRLGFYFEGFGWHSFRRQNITVLQEEGATTFEAMAQAGHSRPSMTGEYTIVGLGRREQAVRRLQERLFLGQQPVSLGVN
jgi:integrase